MTNKHSITIYILQGCPYCKSIIKTAKNRNIKHNTVSLGSVSDTNRSDKIKRCVTELKRTNKHLPNIKTVPFVIQDGKYIGDSTALNY